VSRLLPRLFFSIVVVYSVALCGQSAAADCPSFSSLIRHGAYAVGDVRGTVISGCNIDTPFIPASILKIPTALAALNILGPQYRFKTRFYTDKKHNLYIRGFGDPLLISEEIDRIFVQLKQRGIDRINSIFVDTSRFALEHQVPGREDSSNPYDAPVGPVVVNFNSIAVRVSGKRRIVSAEPQTPTLALTRELAADYLPGTYRLNICSRNRRFEQQMARYTIELFRALQKKAGIPGRGESGIRNVPSGAVLVYEHRNTKNLEYLVSSFLRYSSNFIANLVYLACGAEKFGYPATWSKADRAVHQELVKQLGQQTASAVIQVEGAGLSRNNRITARAMLAALQAFRPYANLLSKRQGVPTKSGSMKKIFNYAGYLKDGNAYVILLNQSSNTRSSVLARLKKDDIP
jgi:D-alanyl-D-alanine carboxypeptidase/D-alanyl-D-alanine-endopeptidase (penicillin-binding protein 4)